MIEFQTIMDRISSGLKDQPYHILNQSGNSNYYSDFEKTVKILSDAGFFKNANTVEVFKKKLQIGNAVFNHNLYFQNIAEVMFWRYAIEKNLTYELEKKVSTENNCDVDLFISHGSYRYNVEIKTPNNDSLQKEENSQVLKVTVLGRVFSKEKAEEEKSKITKDIFAPIIDKSVNSYEKVEFLKNQDNRTLDYLKSAQSKFTYTDNNSLNVLVIAVDIGEIEDYFSHLTFGASGLFTQNSFCTHDTYDKVDFVLLTSLVTGHKKYNDIDNAWSLSNYFNLLVYNPFSKKHKKELPTQEHVSNEYRKIAGLFPDDTERFSYCFVEFLKKQEKDGLPIEGIFMSSYFAEYYPHLWKIETVNAGGKMQNNDE